MTHSGHQRDRHLRNSVPLQKDVFDGIVCTSQFINKDLFERQRHHVEVLRLRGGQAVRDLGGVAVHDDAEQAARRLGLSLWAPGGHDLPMVGSYPDRNGMAFLEVRLVVQDATGFGGDDAEEIIKCDPDLLALVKFAEQNPAPELGVRR